MKMSDKKPPILFKHWWIIILLFLIAPIIINIIMKSWWTWIPLKPEGDVNSWIGFWGNYTGGLLGALIGGIVAYYIAKSQIDAQVKSEKEKNIYDRRMNVFRIIMENRANFINGQVPNNELVKALNQIEIEFLGQVEIIDAWKMLHQSLCYQITEETPQETVNDILKRKNEKYVDLLFEMTKKLNLKMDKDSITNTVYLPFSYIKYDNEQQILKQKIEDLLDGKTSLSMKIINE
jgi:hypothetical protein